MKYEYITATDKTEIEVDERFYEILVSLDKEQFNSDRKHSRRYPVSLGKMEYEGEWLSDGTDILDYIVIDEAVKEAMSCLSERQQYLIRKICLEGWKYTELAALEGKDESAIRHAAKRAKTRLKKFLADRPI